MEYFVRKKNCSYENSFDLIKDVLKDADNVIVNFESPIEKPQDIPRDTTKLVCLLTNQDAIPSLR